jgi:hypothetical protein
MAAHPECEIRTGFADWGDTLGGGAVSAVAEVDGDSEVVHLFDSGDARFAESGIAGLEASIAKDAAIVVGELHDAHAEAAEHFNALGIFLEKCGVLEAGKNPEFVFALGAGDVEMAAHDEERVGILLD